MISYCNMSTRLDLTQPYLRHYKNDRFLSLKKELLIVIVITEMLEVSIPAKLLEENGHE